MSQILPGLQKIILLALLQLLAGCQSLQFYHQAVMGQTRLLLAREDAEDILARSSDPALRDRIALASDILAFAAANGLPAGGAYNSYVETGQPFIVWNVFAAEPFEMQLKKHCFPIAGCVSYRGYFSESDARRYAAGLATEGLEVYVAGAAAYSTLGWFDDPLLDTFLFRSEDRLAALLFHELAHRLVYVPGDTRFNESVATAVEQYLLQRWLSSQDQMWVYEQAEAARQRRAEVIGLIDATRQALRKLYSRTDLSADDMREEKAALFASLRTDYETLRTSWETGSEFSSWMSGELNNAKLETVADYNEWVPVLTDILVDEGMTGFIDRIRELAAMDQTARQAELHALAMR